MQNPWHTLSSRTIYRNHWLGLREDKVIRPDGAEGIYSVVELRPSCGIVAISEDNQIALVGQWRYVHGKYSLEIPTGGSEHDETPLAAAKRELLEETGLTAEVWTGLGSIDNSNGATTDVAHLFLARTLTAGPSVPQGDEQVELRWMPFADAVLSVMNGEITESVSVAAILKVELLRRTIDRTPFESLEDHVRRWNWALAGYRYHGRIICWFLWRRRRKPDLRFRTGEYAARVGPSTAPVRGLRHRSRMFASVELRSRYGTDYELPSNLI